MTVHNMLFMLDNSAFVLRVLKLEIGNVVALMLQRNLLHATSENAIAYAKAMIGIKSET